MERKGFHSEPIIPEQANQEEEKAPALSHSRRVWIGALLAGFAAIGAGVGVANCNSNNGNSHPKEVPAHFFNGAEGCDNSTEISVQYPGNPTEIIPQKANDQQLNNLSDNNNAAKYLEGLFSKKGPMGENYDPAVMSTFWALIGYPATSDGYQTKERILGTFRSSYNQMTTNNDQFNNLSANKFCKINEKVMSQTFDYEDVAIARGTLITQIDALTKNGRKIDNISLKSFNAKEDVSGIVFKIKNKNTDNGFITVVIDKQGNILVTGIQPTAGGSSTTNKSKLNKSKSNHQSPEPISGGGGVTGNGPVQENLPGNSSGNSTGTSNTGNQKESTTGTGSTPSGGRTTTTTKPPTTTVPKSPPTTTIPPTTTTTSPTKKNPDPNPGGCTDPFDPTCQGT